MPEGQSLYVISDGAGNVKVGVGANPRRRLRQLQTGNARCLALRRQAPFTGGDPIDVERYVHWLLREHHVGGEWFSVDEQIALGALMAAAIAVIKGRRAPRLGLTGVGRPPLDRKDVTVKTTIRLPQKLLARIETITGENRMSAWMREAMEEKLQREERARGVVPPKPE